LDRDTRRCAIRVCACLFLCCVSTFALDSSLDVSQYAHASWKLSETFGKGTIWEVGQTPDGYLWLGTELGWRRFDGIRAVEWQPPPGERLPNTEIRNLMTSRDGTLWIGTGGGLASWKSGKLTNYPDSDRADISALPAASIHALQLGSENTLWAATDVGVSRIGNGRVGTLNSSNGLPCDNAHAVTLDGNRSLWIYMDCGLVRVTSPELDSWIADPNRRVQATLFGISDESKLRLALGRRVRA